VPQGNHPNPESDEDVTFPFFSPLYIVVGEASSRCLSTYNPFALKYL
jgi:hypothetical protein